MPQEVTLNFVSGASGVDNPGLSRSDVTINALTAPTGTGFVHITGGTVDGTARAINLSGSDVTSTLGVANGGTGAATLTAHSVLLGEGTSAVASVGPGATGLPLVGQGASADPVFAVLGVAGGGTGLSAAGSNGQVLTIVSGAPAWASAASVTWANDLAGNGTTTSTNQYVSSLSFSSAAAGGTITINGTNTTLQWAASCTSVGLSQAGTGPASGTAQSIVFAPQGANATNGTPGGVLCNFGAPTGTGTLAGLVLQQAGTQFFKAGKGGTNANHYSIWLGDTTGQGSSGSDWCLSNQGGGLLSINAPSGSIQCSIANGNSQFYVDVNGSWFGTASPSFGGGTLVVGLSNATVVPSSAPSGGGLLFEKSGTLYHAEGGSAPNNQQHYVNAWRAYYGDGSDGTGTFDGTATPAGVTKNSSTQYTLNRDVYYTSATISTTVNVITNGWRFFCRDTLTLSGTATLQFNGNNAGNNNGGAAVSNKTLMGSLFGANAPTTGTTAGNAGQAYAGTTGGFGGNGGSGGASSGSGGGAGGVNSGPFETPRSVSELLLGLFIGQTVSINTNTLEPICGGASGGSGGHQTTDGTSAAGGGGAGGGTVLVCARTITGSGNIQALGGVGGLASGASGAGGGGGGGFIGLIYGDKSGWTGAAQVTGGNGGTGGNASGTAGAAGLVVSLQG